MKLFTKGNYVRSVEYENARYIYALCGANLVAFRVYKQLKDGEANPLWGVTGENAFTQMSPYIFEFSHYIDKNGKDRYTLYNVHTGGVKAEQM